MVDNSNVNRKATSPRKNTNLPLSLAMLNECIPINPEDKDDIFPLDREPVSGAQSEEKEGSKSLDPTRYGDWERRGRCIDF